MNELLLGLLSCRKKINGESWILIPPKTPDGILSVSVEWFLNDEKCTFQKDFSEEEIRFSDKDLLDIFINEANRAYKEFVQNP